MSRQNTQTFIREVSVGICFQNAHKIGAQIMRFRTPNQKKNRFKQKKTAIVLKTKTYKCANKYHHGAAVYVGFGK